MTAPLPAPNPSSVETWTPWLQTILSGIVGSVLTLVTAWCVQWFRRPALQAQSGGGVEGSLVPRSYTGSNGEAGFAQWIRVKVANVGRSTAKNVRVMVVSLRNTSHTGEADWEVQSETLDSFWSHLDWCAAIDVPSQTWRFADICLLEIFERNSLIFKRQNGDHLRPQAERLRIDIRVAADNAPTISHVVEIQYQGNEGLRFVGVSQSLH